MVESGKELGILVNTQQLGLLVQLHIFCCRYAAFGLYFNPQYFATPQRISDWFGWGESRNRDRTAVHQAFPKGERLCKDARKSR